MYAAVIPRFITSILTGAPPTVYGDGLQTRDFTYIDNVVQANLKAAAADSRASGESMNIACGYRVSLNQLLRAIADTVGLDDYEVTHTDPRAGDVRDSLADISKAADLIGYQPEVLLEDGLKKTVDWFTNTVASR